MGIPKLLKTMNFEEAFEFEDTKQKTNNKSLTETTQLLGNFGELQILNLVALSWPVSPA